MSSQEYREGRLTPIEVNGDIENTLKCLFEMLNIEIKGSYDSYLEASYDYLYETHVVLNEVVYEVKDSFKEYDSTPDIMEATGNPDGSIDYKLCWYNGGGSFGEIVEQAVDNMKPVEQIPDGLMDWLKEKEENYNSFSGGHPQLMETFKIKSGYIKYLQKLLGK